jgi:hypothetical protein
MKVPQAERRERKRRKDDKLITKFSIPPGHGALMRQEGQRVADIRMGRPLHAGQVRKELLRANHGNGHSSEDGSL